jgi:hypothetical protein
MFWRGMVKTLCFYRSQLKVALAPEEDAYDGPDDEVTVENE